MAAKSPKEWMKVYQWVEPDAYVATDDIADHDVAIDTSGWRYAMVIVSVGDGDSTWAIQVEASATEGGTYADVTGALISVSATDDNARYYGLIDLEGSAANLNRWLQLNGVCTGGTGTDLGVELLLIGPKDTEQYLAWDGADAPEFDV